MLVIFTASSFSRLPTLPDGVTDLDAHFAVYGVLGALLARALELRGRARVRGITVALATIVATAYGMTDELHQAFVPGRTPSWADLGADLLGSLVGAGALWACGIVCFMWARRDDRDGAGGTA